MGIEISPIFNIVDIHSCFLDYIFQSREEANYDEAQNIRWPKKMSKEKPLEDEAILYTKIARKTRRKEYLST